MSTVNPYEMFAINDKAENEIGQINEYPVPGHLDRAFRIRFVHSGDSNVHYREALRARLKPLSFRIQQELVSDEEYEDIVIAVFADKIIKEWSVADGRDESGELIFKPGIYGEDFAILPVSRENITHVFKQGRRLFRDIKKQADSFATFKTAIVEDAVKN